jgi:sugar (pentulose or hexulose) kinase
LKEIFEHVILQVIKLVKDQIKSTNKKIKAVLLVGGFGQNAYLKERLRTALGTEITVMQPTNAWTAVVRGAVMMGLANSDPALAKVGVVSRAARKSYGIEMAQIYDASIHAVDRK